MKLEQKGSCELPHVSEPPFGALPLGLSDLRLPDDQRHRSEQARQEQGCHERGRAMASHEFRQPVCHGVAARADRLSVEVPLDVVRQRLSRQIAAFGFLAQRLQDDGVEVALQLFGSARRGPDPAFISRNAALGGVGFRPRRRCGRCPRVRRCGW